MTGGQIPISMQYFKSGVFLVEYFSFNKPNDFFHDFGYYVLMTLLKPPTE